MGDPNPGVDQAMDAWLDRMHAKYGDGAAPAECRTDAAAQNQVTERDWTGLRTDFVQAVQIWCNSMQHVVNQFEKDVGKSDADSDDISLAASVLKGVVSEFLPKQAKVALAVAGPIMTRVLKDIQTGKVSLRSFCETWDRGFNSFKSAKGEHDKMFATFRKEVEAKCGNDLTLEAVSREISYLSDKLPKSDAVRKALLKAWIDSTEDEGPIFDEWSNVAGYFHVRVLRHDKNRWELQKAYLDDTDEQAGVIAMLQKEYPNTKLEKLPFMMRVYINHGMGYKYLTYGEKGKGGGWTLKEGTQEILDDFRKSGANPTTKNLSKDSIL